MDFESCSRIFVSLLLSSAWFALIFPCRIYSLTGKDSLLWLLTRVWITPLSRSNTLSCWSWQTVSSPTLPTRGRPSSRPPTSPCPSSLLASGMPTSATCRCWMETMGSYAHPEENQSCETLSSSCPSVVSNMWVDRHLVKECRFLTEVLSWDVPQDNIQETLLFPVFTRDPKDSLH